jgi:hypothetical protein
MDLEGMPVTVLHEQPNSQFQIGQQHKHWSKKKKIIQSITNYSVYLLKHNPKTITYTLVNVIVIARLLVTPVAQKLCSCD